METENKKPSNPRMHNVDGMYAAEARAEDFVSLRDTFAGIALQGLISNRSIVDDVGSSVPEWLAIRSYLIADAMLKQRENE